MHIILGEENIKDVGDKYLVLELDSFRTKEHADPVTAYCLIENVPINELLEAERYRDLHHRMMKNYREANWKFCEDALEHLRGRWNGEMDSFYDEIATRVHKQKNQSPDPAWDPSIQI